MHDLPPARDAAFMLATLQRIERRRFVTSLLRVTLLMLAASWVLMIAAPGMQDLLDLTMSAIAALDGLSAITLSVTLVLVVALDTESFRFRL